MAVKLLDALTILHFTVPKGTEKNHSHGVILLHWAERTLFHLSILLMGVQVSYV